MDETPNYNVALVFNGFLALSMKEKVRLVDTLNEFFDHPDARERMRKENEELISEFFSVSSERQCKCCRR